MDDGIAPNAPVRSLAVRCRWRGATLALAVACVGWLSLWSALRVQAAPNALTYPSAVAPCNSTLQACVNAVPAGDTLLILPNTYAIPELTIPRAMALQGTGVVLQAAGAHRVVNIAAGQGTVTLVGLTIRNGSSAANGGGILIGDNTPVQLINVIVRDNQSSADGGGIYAGSGGSLQLIGTRLLNNRAPSGSGGGLRTLANRQVTAAAATFSTNSALSFGAGMYVDGPLIIVASQIASNTVSGGADGGGVYATSSATISGTTVISNVAGDDGGGIYAASVTLDNTTVATNTAVDSGGGVFSTGALNVTGGVIANNGAGFIGGGLVASSAATLTNVIVRDNRSATANGGGIRANNRLIMNGGEVRNNQAFSFGGGMSLLAGAEVSGTQFISNSAGAGGGIVVFGGLIADASVLFTGTNLSVTGNAALLGDGGGLLTMDFVTVTLQGASGTQDFQVSDNRAAGSGGGLYIAGPAVVANCLLANNEANFGGGLFAAGDVTVTGCLIDSNTAITDAGGIFGDGALTTILSSTVRFNQAAWSAGGVWAENAARVDNAAFIANQSGATGGGLHSNGGDSVVVSSTFSANLVGNLVVDGNERGGGAIHQSGGSLTVLDVTLSNNRSLSDGGAVAVNGALTVTNSAFHTNTASSRGGAIFASSVFDTATDFPGFAIAASDFVSNTVIDGDGGAIYAEGPLAITGSHFTRNAATGSSSPQGGAVHHRGSAPAGLLRAADNVYTENYAAQQGGAVFTQGGALSRELVANNRSDSEGGGMMVQGNTTISHSVFTGNVGKLSGALTAAGQSGNAITLTVLSSLFHNNGFVQTNTFAVGAEMKLFDANLVLINNTFADPQMPAGANFQQGVQVFRTAVQAFNNLFVNYPTHGLGHGDPAPVASSLVEDHNLFFNAPLGNFAANLSSGGNSLTADPRFVDAAADNYRLRGDSPAIDAGLDSVLPPALAVDLDGQPRRFDGPPVAANLVDIGAYESRKVLPVAVPGGPYAGLEGSPVALDATGSGGDAPLTFAWDCTGDGAVDQTLAAPSGAGCLYPDNGSFSVRLVLSDGEAISVTAQSSATIANVAPAVRAPGDQAAEAGVATQFDLGSFTDPGADAPWTVVVDWGDSTPATQATQTSAGPIAAQAHTYIADGEYTVTVTVSDKDSGSHSATFRVLDALAQDAIYLPLVAR